ncbi:secretin [Novimethylophilus kurashikiensis]|uniref:Secretin n=1 Tax=Novimethylophilus kurashikiensis TaxID=1825523 RepID=A0A2R5F990_9PROT|nr:hypothetical protein [Novimethylophilus kurashikiensis]GBG14812.1 secretin [Novimethylophilus kurashikiensis]
MTTEQLTADQKVEKLLAAVAVQRKEVDALDAQTKRPWETNCSFKLEWAAVPVNLQTAPLTMVLSLTAELVMRRSASAEAARILGLEDATITLSGFSYEAWEADFKKRVAIIRLQEKRKKLDDVEARLNQLVSPEKRREMELAAVEAELLS